MESCGYVNEVERANDGSFILVVLELPRKEKRAEPSSSSEKKKGAELPPPPGALIFSPSYLTTTLMKNEAKYWQGN